jgi:demethylmenaquinone methyltransferase/2-methoxy-6-polyprenyl-1,4-benzoquinol methylase
MHEIAAKRESFRIFDRIAGIYDLINDVISLGLQRFWRRQMIQVLPKGDALNIIDLATGTADVPLTLIKEKKVCSVLGVDLSQNMLQVGRKKIEKAGLESRISLQVGDAMSLACESSFYDAVTISFGIRNMPDPDRCLQECFRVLKQGGRAIVLEFGQPRNRVMLLLFQIYMKIFVTPIGALMGHATAYRYLDQTVKTFPSGDKFIKLMNEAGFTQAGMKSLMGGIVMLYWADKLKK